MKTTAFVYVDGQNLITYVHTRDSAANRLHVGWRRYVMPLENVTSFMRYWGLRLHPRALKNPVK